MLWLPLLTVALATLLFRRLIHTQDEGIALLVYSVGFFSFCLGFAIAPDPAHVVLEILALGWIMVHRLTSR